MIPWLLITELLCVRGQSLSKLVDERINAYPASGEINSSIDNQAEAIKKVLQRYSPDALSIDYIDGISVEFEKWRFNLRTSNTEPVVRLNVESRGDVNLMNEKTKEILSILQS